MRKRFNLLPTYHFEENTDGQIRGAAERVLRDCTIYGNCGRNLINLDAGIDSNGVLTKNNDGTYKLTKVSSSFRFTKSIPVYIPQNIGFIISFELIEYTGTDSFLPLDCFFKYSDGTTVECVPKNTLSSNERIYSTYYIKQKADIISLQLVCMSSSNQPIGSYTVFKNFQIELGDESYSEGIDYESYAEVGDSDAESGKYILPVTVNGKNLLNSYGYTARRISSPTKERSATNDEGTTISSIEPVTSITVTQTNASNPDTPLSALNGHFCIGINKELIGKNVKMSCDIETISNPLNTSTIGVFPNGIDVGCSISLLETGRVSAVMNIVQNDTLQYIEIRNAGCSMVISNIMITEADETNTDFEPYTAPKTTNLFLDAPLGPGESISCREKGLLLPELATIDPNITNYITFGSEVKPSSAKYDYYKY